MSATEKCSKILLTDMLQMISEGYLRPRPLPWIMRQKMHLAHNWTWLYRLNNYQYRQRNSILAHYFTTHPTASTTESHKFWSSGNVGGGVGGVAAGDPVSRMAAWKSPSVWPPYAVICNPIEIAPADWPKIVTLSQSPPKAWMFFFTHLSASRWSRRPRFRALLAAASLPAIQK